MIVVPRDVGAFVMVYVVGSLLVAPVESELIAETRYVYCVPAVSPVAEYVTAEVPVFATLVVQLPAPIFSSILYDNVPEPDGADQERLI